MRPLYICILFFIFPLLVFSQTNAVSRYAEGSVLSSGNWYKIKVSETGVYKLTYNDLRSMGISNPGNVRIYGYGGNKLEEDFTTSYIDDLPPVAIWMSSPASSFSTSDYILFYGKGSIKWEYDSSYQKFVHTQNPYSFEGYYFVSESSEGAFLMEEKDCTTLSGQEVTTFSDYYLHEKELVNIGESGQEFYGENFRLNSTQNFSLPLTGITSSPATIDIDFVARVTTSGASLTASIDGSLIGTRNITSTSNTYVFATSAQLFNIKRELSSQPTLTLSYNNNNSGTDKNVHLNYIRINYERSLQPYGAVTLFRNTTRSEKLSYKISSADSNIRVFDVTENERPQFIKGSLSGSTYSFSDNNTSIREYALVDVSKTIPTPELVGKVSNQNLHGLESKDMVIIVQPALESYAQQLADLHYEDSGLECIIVHPEDIYNEFSSGTPDVTAYRRFLKMFYDRADKEEDRPQYLLLFGGGSFDNRFVLSSWTQTHKNVMLLTYQTKNSLNESVSSSNNASFVMDDYIGFLDDDEGVNFTSDKLDIGIGRLPVRSQQEAADVLGKIRRYIKNEDKGLWKNNICLIADDAVTTSATTETRHARNTETYANTISTNTPEFIIDKIYEDSFERVIVNGGPRYPDASKALLDKINNGLLVLNYTGHGSIYEWTHEKLLTNTDITNMTNSRLPLWITATCDFSRYDAKETSAGVLALLNPRGGAIALISTIRVVNGDAELNAAILEALIKKENGKRRRLGDILREGKNNMDRGWDNKLRFTLLGDPALRLSYADDDYRIEISRVNEEDSMADNIFFQALSTIRLQGEIVNEDGDIATDFNGILESLIFDSQQTLQTNGYSEHNSTASTESNKVNYTDYINRLYTGKVEVVNGRFEIEFVVPKDILYTDDYGKISMYAYDTTNGREAQGAYLNYRVGGTADEAQEENNPPEVTSLYLNSPSFRSGGVVNSTPLFYASFKDDTGLNLSSAIGHNISLTVDGIDSYNLTSYYEGSSSKEGSVSFQLPEMQEGKHYLQFRVWDVWNNSETVGLDFEVVENYKPTIFDFRIGNNPARENTYFIFTSDLPGSQVKVRYEVYSMTGALQWVHEESGSPSSLMSYTYEWNLQTKNGRRLDAGVYVCRVSVWIDGSAKAHKSQKLIVLEQ